MDAEALKQCLDQASAGGAMSDPNAFFNAMAGIAGLWGANQARAFFLSAPKTRMGKVLAATLLGEHSGARTEAGAQSAVKK